MNIANCFTSSFYLQISRLAKPRCLFALLLLVGLAACDISPVAEGSWQVQVGTGPAASEETWTISDTGQITLIRESGTVTADVELTGSRVSWTIGSLDPEATDRINFSGTVDGNTLSGTLFSQQGNLTVTATRR